MTSVSCGLVSTVGDYLRFAQMLLNAGELDGVRILSTETAQQMTTDAVPANGVVTRMGGKGYDNAGPTSPHTACYRKGACLSPDECADAQVVEKA
jgi:CubicO group peptidase (beta-lactamase class C family)